jgi:sporulation protein YlmC with PRC-barrel domain
MALGYEIPASERAADRRRVLSAGKLSGAQVRNAVGEDLGRLEEVMFDIESGQALYGIISFGGFLGFGNKLFAVPWRALAYNERTGEFLLKTDRRRMEQAPGFDPDHWPDMANPDWDARVQEFYTPEEERRYDVERFFLV